MPALAGSADAPLAHLASGGIASRLVAIVCAEAAAAQRLADEIAWFAPALRIAVLPDWGLPYDHFSPHQDLVSERLATLYRVSRGECDVRWSPRRPRSGSRHLPISQASLSFSRRRITRRRRLARTARPRRLSTRDAGGFPRRIQHRGGLIDLYPMGSPLPFRIVCSIRNQSIERSTSTRNARYPVSTVRLLPAARISTRRRWTRALSQPLSRSVRSVRHALRYAGC